MDPSQWRSSIGTFYNTASRLSAFGHTTSTIHTAVSTTSKLDIVAPLSLMLLTILLFRAGLELNPGPIQRSPTSSPVPDEALQQRSRYRISSQASDDGGSVNLTTLKAILDDFKGDMRAGFDELRSVIESSSSEVKALQRTIQIQATAIADLELKVDDLENRSRRENLIFRNLPTSGRESWSETRDVLRKFLDEKLRVKNIHIDRAHRLGRGDGSRAPLIIARIPSTDDRDLILRCANRLKGTNYGINEDYSTNVRNIRRQLLEHKKTALSEGKKATLQFKYLAIDGRKYTIGVQGQLVPVSPSSSSQTFAPNSSQASSLSGHPVSSPVLTSPSRNQVSSLQASGPATTAHPHLDYAFPPLPVLPSLRQLVPGDLGVVHQLPLATIAAIDVTAPVAPSLVRSRLRPRLDSAPPSASSRD